MLPFVAKYQSEGELVKWIRGEEQPFPQTEFDGAIPRVPPVPTFKELYDYCRAKGTELPQKKVVEKEMEKLDPLGDRRREIDEKEYVG